MGIAVGFREVAGFELVKLTIITHGADGLSTINASMEVSGSCPSYLKLLDSPWEFYVLVLSLSSQGMGITVGFREVAGFELVKLTIISPNDSLVPTFDK